MLALSNRDDGSVDRSRAAATVVSPLGAAAVAILRVPQLVSPITGLQQGCCTPGHVTPCSLLSQSEKLKVYGTSLIANTYWYHVGMIQGKEGSDVRRLAAPRSRGS
jgi:hypothetical protein